jgi:hypothetical protein
VSISKFYLHAAATSDTGTLPSSAQSGYTILATEANANVNKSMDASKGAAQVGSTNTSSSGGWLFARRFLSAPLGAQTFSGTVTMSDAGAVSSGVRTLVAGYYIGVWRPSTGAKVGDLFAANPTTGSPAWTGAGGTTAEEAGSSGANSLSSVACLDGDILIVELYSGGVLGLTSSRVFYDGATEGSTTDNAAFVSFSSPVLMGGEGGGGAITGMDVGISMIRDGVV